MDATLDSSLPSIPIVYGTQTGTAAEVSAEIGRRIRQEGWRAHAEAAETVVPDIAQLALRSILVFVVATTGKGQMPRGMIRLWTALRARSLTSESLRGVRFAVFGLGDSRYTEFNFAAKMLFRRLQQLGADPLLPRGDGDDQHAHGYDAALEPWITQLLSVLPRLPAEFRLERKEDPLADPYLLTLQRGGGNQDRLASSSPSSPTVLEKRLLTAEGWIPAVVHLDVAVPGLAHAPPIGAVAYVVPENSDDILAAFFKRVGLPLDDVLVSAEHAFGVASLADVGLPLSLWQLFKRHYSLSQPPSRHFYAVAARFARCPVEQERLTELSSAEGMADLLEYGYRERRTIPEILDDFPSVQLPLPQLLGCIPRMRPRAYSLSGAPTAFRVSLTVSVPEFRTPMRRKRWGVCSKFLRDVLPGTSLRLWVEPGSLRMPPAHVPLLLVGPGTGIAPFRALLLAHREPESSSTSPVNPSISLYAGFRHAEKDFLYAEDLANLLASGRLARLRVAFSRDQPQKVYVQHLLLQDAEFVARHLHAGGALMVCGSSNQMPDQVRETVIAALARHMDSLKDPLAARDFVLRLQKSFLYQEETW